MQFLKDYTKSA